MNKETYLKSGFNSYFDKYYSEDYIYGFLENGTSIEISDLCIEKTDYDNTSHNINVFSGIYEYIKLPVQLSDIIEKILEFAKNTSLENKLTIKFKNNELFFAIDGDNQFEIPKIKSFVDKETLKKYYNIVDYSIQLANLFVDRIKELNG